MGKFAQSVEEFLVEHGGTVQSAGEDTLVVNVRQLRQELDGLSGWALDSAWAHRVSERLDDVRVQAIFIDSKQLQHKKVRGRESSLRWAWGESYLRTCVVRKRLAKRELACGGPPEEPSQGRVKTG